MKIDLYKNGFSDRFMRILVLTVGCLGLFIANLWPINARAEKAEAIESAAREKLHETQQQIRSRGVRARGDLKFYSGKVSLRAIDLSQDLQTEDLVKAGQLGSPLTPSTSNSHNAETDQADNRQFAEAIQKWNQHHYDEAVKLFAAHIKAHPKSPWLGESQLHLGCEAQFSGRWNEAETHFNNILSTNARGSDIYQKAKLRHAILMVEKGQFSLARTEFTELLGAESSWERRTYAQHWLLQVDRYEAHATQLRVCGRDAIVKVLELSGKKDSAQKARLESAQNDQGFSIAELLEFAHKYGLNGTAVRVGANLLTKLPFPFIAHYSDNHYVAVLAAVGNDKIRLYDPRLQRETVISQESFLSQWSGIAVIFGPPPSGVKLVSNTEAQDVVGGWHTLANSWHFVQESTCFSESFITVGHQ
jgi:TolA-binding protein